MRELDDVFDVEALAERLVHDRLAAQVLAGQS